MRRHRAAHAAAGPREMRGGEPSSRGVLGRTGSSWRDSAPPTAPPLSCSPAVSAGAGAETRAAAEDSEDQDGRDRGVPEKAAQRQQRLRGQPGAAAGAAGAGPGPRERPRPAGLPGARSPLPPWVEACLARGKS